MLDGVALPMLLPGISVHTDPHSVTPIGQIRNGRFDGKSWVLFGIFRARNSLRAADGFRRASTGSLEIIVDDAQVGKRGLLAVGARLDHPPADFGGRFIPEIVRGFENGPGGIQ
jgi:hypothetical protein